MKELAHNLWVTAEAAAKPGEVLLALRVVDFSKKDFIEFNLALTIGGPSGVADGPAESEELGLLIANECHGEMAGLVGGKQAPIRFQSRTLSP